MTQKISQELLATAVEEFVAQLGTQIHGVSSYTWVREFAEKNEISTDDAAAIFVQLYSFVCEYMEERYLHIPNLLTD